MVNGFWLEIRTEFSTVSERAINILLLFYIMCLCEIAFTESTIIKIKIMKNSEK